MTNYNTYYVSGNNTSRNIFKPMEGVTDYTITVIGGGGGATKSGLTPLPSGGNGAVITAFYTLY